MARFELHPGREVGEDRSCYIIAEIGQNHQGDVNIAMELVRKAAAIGCDCVKFQKSNLAQKFNRKALNRPYLSEHSFGQTYGEHKTSLEFSDEQFGQLKNYATSQGIQFTASPMDEKAVEFLDQLQVPFLKIGSGDINNYPLIMRAAKKGRPLVMSTGMHDLKTIKNSVDLASKFNRRIAVLQCTSAYPCPPADVHLNIISLYHQVFPGKVVGYSGHEKSWPITLAAVSMGAKVVERHLTLDHGMKGSDHGCSLEPDEFDQLIKNIRIIEEAFGKPEKRRQQSEEACYRKLGKTVVAARELESGTTISFNDLLIKVADPPGIEAHRIYNLVGRLVLRDLDEDESINEGDLGPESQDRIFPDPFLETSL